MLKIELSGLPRGSERALLAFWEVAGLAVARIVEATGVCRCGGGNDTRDGAVASLSF
jgi:hypothetical protein